MYLQFSALEWYPLSQESTFSDYKRSLGMAVDADPSKVSLRYILSQIIDTLWQGLPNGFALCLSAKRLYPSSPILSHSHISPALTAQLLCFFLLLWLFTLASGTPLLFSQLGKRWLKGKIRSLASLYSLLVSLEVGQKAVVEPISPFGPSHYH